MKLTIRLGTKADLLWAQETVTQHHYLHQPASSYARPMAYIIEYGRERLGCIVAGLPHATRNRGWWGYPGLPTQWQVLDLCRIWLSPRLQLGGDLVGPDILHGFYDRRRVFRPTVASWAIKEVFGRIQQDWISLWPPVYPEQPYHIRLVISYHDPAFHKGTLYRAMGWEPMYRDEDGEPIPADSGKFGWCWRLPEPDWTWDEIKISRPRTMRLPM